MPSELIECPTDLTDDRLTTVLGAGTVTGHHFERIGTGQMSECYRVHLRYADGETGPASVVLKVAAADPNSRQTGLALGLYEREVRFYAEIAPALTGGGGVTGESTGPFAPCFHHAYDAETGAFDLLLADASPATVGDEIRGATVEQAMLAVRELGRVHGPLLGDEGLAQAAWLNREAPVSQALLGGLWAGFAARFGDRIAPEHRRVCERLVEAFDAYLAQEADGIQGLVHGDYRLDNMLFGQAGAQRPLTVVDWQTVTRGPALTDLAYFIGCALPDEVRRAHYDALLRGYHAALGDTSSLSLEDVRAGVRRQSFFGVMMAIVSSMLVAQTERGDEMFMTMLARHCAHVLDTDALAVLPDTSRPDPLTPDATDEGPHAHTDEALWNESWYFDFVDAAQGLGGWVRLGLIPNQDTAWINALLCGPGMPTVAVNDLHAALPADPARVRTERLDLELAAVVPLQRYRVTLRARGEAFDDPAGLLRGASGRPVEVGLDLEFVSVSTPYLYRITPRYEIACSVSGTATIDGQHHPLNAVPGQRDHSWGVRDWWSMDWTWSALHLQDGTHLHGVDIRIPGMAPIGIGYAQREGEALIELESVSAQRTLDEADLPSTATLTLQPGDIEVNADIMGHAPVLLTSADGRVSQFPRAWATVTTADGRKGVGWLEFNRNL
ncbi:ecdysteroid 22-kinase family protein [Mycobacterium sp. MBM]|nr:ecdysteroid 22-kinase family protein [Mycobacterium sp. MBM]